MSLEAVAGPIQSDCSKVCSPHSQGTGSEEFVWYYRRTVVEMLREDPEGVEQRAKRRLKRRIYLSKVTNQ